MSLNNNQMLPARVRNMRQMKDVLDVEDIILAEIERIMDEMYQRASLLHEELVNEVWLESRLSGKTGADVSVAADAERLFVTITLDTNKVGLLDIKSIREFIEKWLPAHLAYQLVLQRKKKAEVFVCSTKEVFISMEKGINPESKAVLQKIRIKILHPSAHYIAVSYSRKGS